MHDIFKDYIERHRGDEQCVALVAASYKQVYQKQHHRQLPDARTNTDLATYGDALLRFSLMGLFLNKEDDLSEHVKPYLTDEFLIEHVARHYHLLDYILFDRDNPRIPKEYTFYESDRTKYIATTVEAILGAIFLEQGDLKAIFALVESFTHL
ncbi:MAG: hypothetical protein IJW83_02080 [Clostridia bacterium]|nr:hypothetical protein [Clostridia bacterium]